MRKKRKVVRRKRSLRRTIEKKRIINFVVIVLAIVTVIFIVYAGNLNNSSVVYGPMLFYDESTKNISVNEFVDFAEKNNFSLYLPSVLPNNLKLTAIYLKESPFIGLVVYSAEGNEDYRTAEVVFEIALAQFVPTFGELESQAKDSPYISVLNINGWVVCINERADSGGDPEFRRKYGDYTFIVSVWIDKLEYSINAPTLTKSDVIPLVGNMKLKTS